MRFLKKKGNFDHNATVASCGAGEMVACRRLTTQKQSENYRHCKFCQGLNARNCLWRHVKNCPQKPVEEEPQVGRKRISLNVPRPDRVHEVVWKIACEMNQDDISLVVRNERDLLSLCESLYNARKPQERRNDCIRQKMREMARLLIKARVLTPLKNTEDLVMPSNFPYVIQAVRAVAGYELESNSYKIPSLALKLGHSLAKVAGIVQCNAIIANRHVDECVPSNLPLCMRKDGQSQFRLLHWVHFNKPNGINHRFYPLLRMCRYCTIFLLLSMLSA